jgi:hypothetical protein
MRKLSAVSGLVCTADENASQAGLFDNELISGDAAKKLKGKRDVWRKR